MVAGGGVLEVLGVSWTPPEEDEPVEDPVDPVLVLVVDGDVVVEVVVVVVVVAVVATSWGVNGLRPRPASFDAAGVVLIEIAGSVVPVE